MDLLPVADTFDALSTLIRAQVPPAAPAPDAPPQDLATAAISLVKPFVEMEEGDKLTAYQDINGTWTIGYGHTLNVTPGMTITQPQADMLLAQDLLTFAGQILPLLTVIPGVGQYAALISLAYNIGVTAFKTSSVLKAHNAGNPPTAAADFLLWDKAHVNGVLTEIPGLLARRKAEAAMYLGTA